MAQRKADPTTEFWAVLQRRNGLSPTGHVFGRITRPRTRTRDDELLRTQPKTRARARARGAQQLAADGTPDEPLPTTAPEAE